MTRIDPGRVAFVPPSRAPGVLPGMHYPSDVARGRPRHRCLAVPLPRRGGSAAADRNRGLRARSRGPEHRPLPEARDEVGSSAAERRKSTCSMRSPRGAQIGNYPFTTIERTSPSPRCPTNGSRRSPNVRSSELVRTTIDFHEIAAWSKARAKGGVGTVPRLDPGDDAISTSSVPPGRGRVPPTGGSTRSPTSDDRDRADPLRYEQVERRVPRVGKQVRPATSGIAEQVLEA